MAMVLPNSATTTSAAQSCVAKSNLASK